MCEVAQEKHEMDNNTAANETEQNATGYDVDLWKAVLSDNAPFIKLESDTPKIIRFLTNDPDEISTNDYDQDVWAFKVLDAAGIEKDFDVASMLLKRALYGAMPLTEVDVVITKTGEGYDTAYTVERVE